MTDSRDFRHDLEADTPPEVVCLAEYLIDARPLPSPRFRGQLRRWLEARSHGIRPPALIRARIARYATAGTFLLLVGAISAAGVGPLG